MGERLADVPLLQESASADLWYCRVYSHRLILPYALFSDDDREWERDDFRLAQSKRTHDSVRRKVYNPEAPKDGFTDYQFERLKKEHKKVWSEFAASVSRLTNAEPYHEIVGALPPGQLNAAYLIGEAFIALWKNAEQRGGGEPTLTRRNALRLASVRASGLGAPASTSRNSLFRCWKSFRNALHLVFADLYVRSFRAEPSPRLMLRRFSSHEQFREYLGVATFMQQRILLPFAEQGRTGLSSSTLWRVPEIDQLPQIEPRVPVLTAEEIAEMGKKVEIR